MVGGPEGLRLGGCCCWGPPWGPPGPKFFPSSFPGGLGPGYGPSWLGGNCPCGGNPGCPPTMLAPPGPPIAPIMFIPPGMPPMGFMGPWGGPRGPPPPGKGGLLKGWTPWLCCGCWGGIPKRGCGGPPPPGPPIPPGDNMGLNPGPGCIGGLKLGGMLNCAGPPGGNPPPPPPPPNPGIPPNPS